MAADSVSDPSMDPRSLELLVSGTNIWALSADGEGTTFDGASRITYDISGDKQYVQTRSDHIKLRFRTSQADGLLIYADGNQGDYVILELIRGRLYFHIDLGEQ